MIPAHSEIKPSELILRDILAIDRTRLANQRTLLSYLRTCFACVAGAAAMIKFFESFYVHALSYGLVGLSAVMLVVGILHFQQEEDRLRHLAIK